VTVCVAALCDLNTIIGASDRMITAGDVQFEPAQVKAWWMNPSIVVMISGDTALQTEILLGVHAEVRERIERDPANWWTVREVADLYVSHYNAVRADRAENALLTPFGLTRDAFISRQSEMSISFLRDLSVDLLSYELPPISAIIAGVDPTGGHLWLISKATRGVVATCQDSSGFASIGIGRGHAQSQLMFSKHTRFQPFAETLFLAYLSKKRAEVAPGVGGGTDMFLISGLGKATVIDESVTLNLERIYKATRKSENDALRRAGVSATQYVAQLFHEAHEREQGTPIDDAQ
jgi:hypothetical protein